MIAVRSRFEPWRFVVFATLLVGALAAVGCTAKLSGDVQVDGSAFSPKACRSGVAFGFSGVEVTDAAGRRMRVVANVDGTATAALFAPGAEVGDTLGTCAKLSLHAQNSRVNSIRNVAGTASLACNAQGHTVTGQFSFENCH